MLVVVLQFCRSDWQRAAKLACLLADVETRRRDDVCLLFSRTSDFVENPVMDEAMSRCSEKFVVESLVVRPDTPERRRWLPEFGVYPAGCFVQWAGAAEYVARSMGSRWSTIFFADGGDGAPLHRDWIDVSWEDHERTLRAGLQVTGALREFFGKLHVNGNMWVERSLVAAHPELLVVPEHRSHDNEGWDVCGAPVFVPAARISSAVYCGWSQRGARPEHLARHSAYSAWWHGPKDEDFVDLARAHVLGFSRPRPVLVDLGRASELRHSRFSP